LGIKKLGEKDFNTLCYLFTLLNDIVRKQELNLMSAKAIATIWSPILFKDGEGVDLVEIMIKNCEKIYEKIKMRKRIEDIMAKKIDNNNFNELELDKKLVKSLKISKRTQSDRRDLDNEDDEEEEEINTLGGSPKIRKKNKVMTKSQSTKNKKKSSNYREIGE